MSDSERDAQERLRQAQEGRREADEGVRRAQEGVRETKENVGADSRQSGEVERVGGEVGRVAHEDERETAETSREEAEAGREEAEDRREAVVEGAETERARVAEILARELRFYKLRQWILYVVLFGTIIGFAIKLTSEGHKREDQFCTSAEREHATWVRQYTDTILYLETVKKTAPQQLMDPINQFVILRLPETEKRAREDTAPPLCDGMHRGAVPFFGEESEIGLPEPDPVLPKATAADVQRELAR